MKQNFSEKPLPVDVKSEAAIDALKALPPEQRDNVIAAFEMSEVAMHSGPLPHPDILRGYETILPGAAERILKMAESEQAHQHSVENQIVKSNTRAITSGQILGFLIAILFLAVSTALIFFDHAVEGCVLGSVDLCALVAVFVNGQKKDRNNSENASK